jgi:hypothetical protein
MALTPIQALCRVCDYNCAGDSAQNVVARLLCRLDGGSGLFSPPAVPLWLTVTRGEHMRLLSTSMQHGRFPPSPTRVPFVSLTTGQWQHAARRFFSDYAHACEDGAMPVVSDTSDAASTWQPATFITWSRECAVTSSAAHHVLSGTFRALVLCACSLALGVGCYRKCICG